MNVITNHIAVIVCQLYLNKAVGRGGEAILPQKCNMETPPACRAQPADLGLKNEISTLS